METYDAAKDGLAPVLPLAVLGDDPRPDLDFLPNLEDAGEDGAACDATFEVCDF